MSKSDFEKNGIHIEGGEAYFRLGNLRISKDEVVIDVNGNEDLVMNWATTSKYDDRFIADKLLSLIELDDANITQILDASILFIINQFTSENLKAFIMAIIGTPGNFKTTISQKCCFVTVRGRKQFCQFPLKPRYDDVSTALLEVDNLPLIVDDVLPVFESSKRQKQLDYWNNIARARDIPDFMGTLILTTERFPQKLLASSYDRIWFVNQKELTDFEKKNWHSVLCSVPENMMACFWVDFIQKLLDAKEVVEKDIAVFLRKYDDFNEINRDTRMWEHVRSLLVCDFIFKKYYLNTQIPDISEFIWAYVLKSSFFEQAERITKLKAKEKGADCILLIYAALFGVNRKIRIFTDRFSYNSELEKMRSRGEILEGIAFLQGDYIYATGDTLLEAVRNRTDADVTLKLIRVQLNEQEILVSNEGKSQTVTVFCVRNYRLNLRRLNEYVQNNDSKLFAGDKGIENTMIVDVHRKGGCNGKI